MALTREEIKQKMTELLGYSTPENQAKTSELLTALSDEFESILTESETASNRVAELTKSNEQLRAVNTDLFLKVGTTIKETHKEDVKTPEFESENKITFEELFNEKGELK